jgi:type I restriction-modification system DNA methylase subunit
MSPTNPKTTEGATAASTTSRHQAPGTSGGKVGFVLANGSMSYNQSGEGNIRRSLIEAERVDCMVALPGQLFYSTQIPVCLWFLAKNKNADAKRGFRDRLEVENQLAFAA